MDEFQNWVYISEKSFYTILCSTKRKAIQLFKRLIKKRFELPPSTQSSTALQLRQKRVLVKFAPAHYQPVLQWLQRYLDSTEEDRNRLGSEMSFTLRCPDEEVASNLLSCLRALPWPKMIKRIEQDGKRLIITHGIQKAEFTKARFWFVDKVADEETVIMPE